MVSSAVRSLTPWLQPGTASLPGATASALSNTVCRMVPLANQRSSLGRVPGVAAALEQLVRQTMVLRSPTGGWPTDLPQTPEHLGPYLSEEIWELLEALEAMTAPAPAAKSALVPIPTLVPALLWMLASGGYEIMRLIEGVQARVYDPDGRGAVHIVRLVPVLVLTVEETRYALDLVTQTAPVSSLYLAEATEIQLLENDLDSQPILCSQLLARIAELVSNTQPGLNPLLGDGCAIDTLRPFQPWQPATLTVHLHLAEMATQGQPQIYESAALAVPDTLCLPPTGRQHGHGAAAASFTLDDFASTLVDNPDDATTRVLGSWLTFTDEQWIQTFLSTCAQQVISQNLHQIVALSTDDEPATRAERLQQREAACNLITYRATDLVRGANSLFKHTFVHEPVLVADVWPRLRWYLAQSSERVMQLMGGVIAQVLPPGMSWQQGSLYLRPLLQLTTPSHSWIIDLSRGRILPTVPQALPADAVVDVADNPWSTPLTVTDLTGLVDYDLATFTPAIAALRQGTPIHLHRLDGDTGCQAGQLTLDWCFTLQNTL
ncbi:hypothetical protein IQ254_03760 [Nodosilinea sp. LEGE 07088]|uniref:hypothetical protein n=1 Tax=Nodosilinea sp. LEGE 07088 TaxID=2777968 RepID=UPI00187F69BD|nr:hypothetical protein [Nodosilinea sp. LEGE 07088]MBE9136326.1 hypothetical protein [Nodosilinea sp. LEGE 07088]